MKKIQLCVIGLACCAFTTFAQEVTVSTANDYLTANKKTDVTILFNTQSEGVKTPVIWGLDTAWPSEDNVRRGTNHIGKEHLGVGRVSFQPSDLIGEDGQLSSEQKRRLDERLRYIAISGVKDIALNIDHEVLCEGEDDTEERKKKALQGYGQLLSKQGVYCSEHRPLQRGRLHLLESRHHGRFQGDMPPYARR